MLIFDFNKVSVLIKIVIEFDFGILNRSVGMSFLFFLVLLEFLGVIILWILFFLKLDLLGVD